jgi:hypothetical protein
MKIKGTQQMKVVSESDVQEVLSTLKPVKPSEDRFKAKNDSNSSSHSSTAVFFQFSLNEKSRFCKRAVGL